MSQFPEDDKKLIDFLRRHQPQPSPADPVLENRILAAIEPGEATRSPRRSRYWLPATIAASLVAGLFTYRSLTPPPPQPNEVSGLETFIETTWNNTFTADEASDLSPLTEMSDEG